MNNNKNVKKAYDNKQFIHSRGGRILRIISEYLYPEQRLQRMGIKRTVIFFGSARIKPPELLLSQIDNVKSKLKQNPDSDSKLSGELKQLELQLELSDYYNDAREIARELTLWSQKQIKANQIHICSGGGPGIMEAANRGSYDVGGRSIGLNISLPFEQEPNPFIHPDLNFEFHYFFMRKFWLVFLSQVMIIFPGGFGTIDEMMEILTLRQTQKMRKPRQIILYSEKWWRKVINFDFLADMGMIDRNDLELFTFVNNPKEAVHIITKELSSNKVRNRF